MTHWNPRREEEGKAKEMLRDITTKNCKNRRKTVIKIPIIFKQVK